MQPLHHSQVTIDVLEQVPPSLLTPCASTATLLAPHLKQQRLADRLGSVQVAAQPLPQERTLLVVRAAGERSSDREV
jgi:hypothetical protein